MSRKKRIAMGSGHQLAEINQFVRQFEEMRKMMHKMSKMQGAGAAGGGRRSKTRTRKGRR